MKSSIISPKLDWYCRVRPLDALSQERLLELMCVWCFQERGRDSCAHEAGCAYQGAFQLFPR